MKSTILIIEGTSASSKTTILRSIEDFLNIPLKITCTTRDIRKEDGEQEGVDYHFLTKDKFKELIGQDNFIEYDEYPPNSPNSQFYGTPKNILSFDNNKINSIIVTPNGFLPIKEQAEKEGVEVIHVHLKIDDDVKRQRLIDRGDKPKDIEKRMNDGIEQKSQEMIKQGLSNPEIIDVSYLTKEEVKYKFLKILSSKLKEINPETTDELKITLSKIEHLSNQVKPKTTEKVKNKKVKNKVTKY